MKTYEYQRYIVWLLLTAIIALGLELRLHSIAYTVVDRPLRADALEYMVYAHNLKYLKTYSKTIPRDNVQPKPDAKRSPGYPLFLSIFIDERINKDSLANILYFQAGLSAIVILIVFGVFNKILGANLALLVALLTSLSPHLVTINVYFLSESIFVFLLLGFMWLLSKLDAESTPLHLIALGAVLAFASLTRPWLQYFILLLIPLIPYRRKSIILLFSFIAVMSLWFMRNMLTLGFLTDSSLMATSILHGSYPGFKYLGDPSSYGIPYRFDPNANEISGSLSAVMHEIFRKFREMPYEYFYWYIVGKPMSLFSWDIVQGMGDVFIYPVLRSPYFELVHFKITHEFMRAIHLPLVILAIVGSAIAWLPKSKLAISEKAVFISRCLSLLLGYFILVHIVAAPFPRYTLPMLPLIYGMAVFGGMQSVNLLKAKLG